MTDQTADHTDQTIIQRVDALIVAQGKSARAVAAAAAIDASTLSRARKSASGELSVETLRRLAPVLGTTVAYLAGETDDPTGQRQPTTAGDTAVVRLAYNDLKRSPLNPRKAFDTAAIRELADSIEARGLIQNITVRVARDHDGRHQIIAGERRWRAIGLLVDEGRWDPRKATIPCRLLDVDDRGHLELAIIENLQRQDVTPLEEAEGLAQLKANGMTTAEIAKAIGTTQRYVQQALALSEKLTDEAKTRLRTGELTKSQARALATLPAVLQASVLRQINDKTSEAEVKRMALDDCVSMDKAIFDPTGDDAARVLVDGNGTRWFQGRDRFAALQQAAAWRTVEVLKDEWSWAAYLHAHHFSDRTWVDGDTQLIGTTEDRDQAGAVVWLHPVTLSVEVKTMLRRKDHAADADAAPTPADTARTARMAETSAFAANLRAIIAGDHRLALSLWLYHTLAKPAGYDAAGFLSGGQTPDGLGAGNVDADGPLAVLGDMVERGPGFHESHVRFRNPAPLAAWPALGDVATLHMLDAFADRIADLARIPTLEWTARDELHPILRQIATDAGLRIPDALMPEQRDLEDAPDTPATEAAE